MKRLWNYFDGEPFLDNPSLFTLNPKRGAKMRVRSKSTGRFIKRRRAASPRRKARARTRKVVRLHRGQVALVNPRRRRRSRPHSRRTLFRRGYRRNPNLIAGLGFDQATLKSVGFTVLGVAGTPFLEGFINRFLPVAITANQIGRYAVKIGSAVGLGFAVRQFMGRDAARPVFVGGAVYVVMSAIRDFAPGILGNGAAQPAIVSGLGNQPLLGAYDPGGMGSYITDKTPDRLRPESRF